MTDHQATNQQDIEYMQLALEQAALARDAGEVPIGSVVVYWPHDPATRRPLADPRVIAQACNRRETDRNPAGHAEFLAMQAAARELGAWRLSGCTVYVTLEPCIMCAGLMHQARIDRCVFGASDPKAGALGTLYRIHEDERLNHNFEVVGGVLAEESSQLLRTFFAERRGKKDSGARRITCDCLTIGQAALEDLGANQGMDTHGINQGMEALDTNRGMEAHCANQGIDTLDANPNEEA